VIIQLFVSDSIIVNNSSSHKNLIGSVSFLSLNFVLFSSNIEVYSSSFVKHRYNQSVSDLVSFPILFVFVPYRWNEKYQKEIFSLFSRFLLRYDNIDLNGIVSRFSWWKYLNNISKIISLFISIEMLFQGLEEQDEKFPRREIEFISFLWKWLRNRWISTPRG
jgi:hypothetical protein